MCQLTVVGWHACHEAITVRWHLYACCILSKKIQQYCPLYLIWYFQPPLYVLIVRKPSYPIIEWRGDFSHAVSRGNTCWHLITNPKQQKNQKGPFMSTSQSLYLEPSNSNHRMYLLDNWMFSQHWEDLDIETKISTKVFLSKFPNNHLETLVTWPLWWNVFILSHPHNQSHRSWLRTNPSFHQLPWPIPLTNPKYPSNKGWYLWPQTKRHGIVVVELHNFSFLCAKFCKGEVGNAILNTKSKTGFPLFPVCNKYTGVNWLF